MKLFAGIDGGQSSTSAVVGDESGTVLGRGNGPPADEVAQDAESTRLHDALSLALGAALLDARQAHDTRFESVVAGISGYDGRVVGVAPAVPSKRFELLHDAPVAHAAAFGEGPGVLVIAGTGSVAYGRNEHGDELRVGGWGFLFGDEGSAFWIARRCIERAMRDEDAGAESELQRAVLAHLGQASLRDVQHAVAAGTLGRDAIAAFAQHALALAQGGDGDARPIADQAADALAALAALCARRLHGDKRVTGHAVPLAFSGGLLADAWFEAHVRARVADRLPEAQIVAMQRTPAEGALLLAIERSKRA